MQPSKNRKHSYGLIHWSRLCITTGGYWMMQILIHNFLNITPNPYSICYNVSFTISFRYVYTHTHIWTHKHTISHSWRCLWLKKTYLWILFDKVIQLFNWFECETWNSSKIQFLCDTELKRKQNTSARTRKNTQSLQLSITNQIRKTSLTMTTTTTSTATKLWKYTYNILSSSYRSAQLTVTELWILVGLKQKTIKAPSVCATSDMFNWWIDTIDAIDILSIFCWWMLRIWNYSKYIGQVFKLIIIKNQ